MRLLLVALVLPLVALAKPTRFDMRDGGLRNLVEFVSDALLEKTVGISNAVTGWIELDPDKVGDGIKGEFEVDVRTFETGIEPRNEAVRDKMLLAPEFPIATFTLSKVMSVSKPKLAEGQPVIARVDGTLKAKGIQKPVPVNLKLVYLKESDVTRQRLPGNLLKVSATFDVDTALFGITVPDAFKSRFARFIQVSADVVGSDRPPAPPGEKPKGDAKK